MKKAIINCLLCIFLLSTRAAWSLPDNFSTMNFYYVDDEIKTACLSSLSQIRTLAESRSASDITAPFYHLQFYLTQYLARGDGRSFNLAMAPIQVNNETKYLFAARVHINLHGNRSEIIPGNAPTSHFEKGKNFWWMNWCSEQFASASLFFLADSNLQNWQSLFPADGLDENALKLFVSVDLRITEENGKTYVYQPNAYPHHGDNFVYELNVVGNRLNLTNPIKRPLLKGANLSLLNLDTQTQSFSLIDWFYENGVKIISSNNGDLSEYYIAKSESFPLLGEETCGDAKNNEGYLPYFSLSTPHIPLPCDEKNQSFLGVGHIKILTGPSYLRISGKEIPCGQMVNVSNPNAPIKLGDYFCYNGKKYFNDQADFPDFPRQEFATDAKATVFTRNLVTDFKLIFQDRYIQHDANWNKSNDISFRKGFHYLFYFYIITLGEKPTLKISDAFLPIFLGPTDYRFSMFFPAGLLRHSEDEILVSGGYGDYRCVILKFSLGEAIKSCLHDASSLNMKEDFNYHLLATNNADFFAQAESFKEIKNNLCQNPKCLNKPSKRCPCQTAKYCSATCQKDHWPEHRKSCTNSKKK